MPGPTVDPSLQIGGTSPALPRILVLVGVTFEERGLARRLGLHRRVSGDGARSLVLCTVGLGAAALSRLEPSLRAIAPRLVLASGLCGGCAPDLGPGDVIVGSPVGSAVTGTWLTPAPTIARRAIEALQAAAVPHRVGPLLTVPEVVATAAAKADCWRRHGALAVDLESAAVLAWAARVGVPALAVRAVGDGPMDALPAALTGAVTPTGDIQFPRLLRLMIEPGGFRTAWRAWRRSQIALDRLARFLAAFAASTPLRSRP